MMVLTTPEMEVSSFVIGWSVGFSVGGFWTGWVSCSLSFSSVVGTRCPGRGLDESNDAKFNLVLLSCRSPVGGATFPVPSAGRLDNVLLIMVSRFWSFSSGPRSAGGSGGGLDDTNDPNLNLVCLSGPFTARFARSLEAMSLMMSSLWLWWLWLS